jgi:hypothetical protein
MESVIPMASPLATIRKYDKVLLAVFGVLLMLSFLIADPLSMMTGGGSGGGGGGRRSNAPVTFKGGSLTDEQLARMHRADVLADAFVERVKEAAQKDNKSAQIGMFPYVDNPQFGASRSESRLVQHYLLAQKAHEMGLSMSNEDVDDLLKNLTDGAIGDAELKKIRQKLLAEDVNSAIIITEKDLYAQLRINFLAQEVMAMVRNTTHPLQFERVGFMPPSAVTLPPAKAWELFRRTARQATVELLPLEVEKFVDDVTTSPTPRQKDELFEKYKNDVPVPFSPDPGFASPHKIAFGYIRVDFQPFLDKAKAEVTEEAIRADYDERAAKGEFTVPVVKEDKPGETKPDDAQPDEEGKKEPADEQKEGEQKEGEPKDDSQEEKEEKKADDSPNEQPADNAKDEEEEEVADEVERRSDKETEDKAADEKKPDEKDDPEAKTDEKTPEDKKAEDETADDKKPENKKPDDKKVETRVKTYEEMKETIREQLAQKPAQDAQREALTRLFEALEEYHTKYREWEIEKEALANAKGKEKGTPSPQPELLPAIGAVLKKYDFKYQQTELVDGFEIQEEELGKASVMLPNQQQITLSDFYMYDIKLYQAFSASEGFLRDTQYIFWKEADQPYRPGERKEVEDQIVRALKLQEAFKLAKAEAEKLAAKAREQADESLLKSVGPVDKAAAVIEPRPFSWLSIGFAPGGLGMPLRESEIAEVPYPGEDFMQTVLDLQPGEIGVAADQPHKRVYVIRLISQTPDEDILRQMFLTRGVTDRNVSQQYNEERLRTLGAWLDNVLDKEMQVKWNRPPQRYDGY